MHLLILSIILLSFYSCNTIMIKTIGIKEQKELSIERLNKFIRKKKLPSKTSFYIADTEKYFNFLKERYLPDSTAVKQSMQPLKVMYFVNDNLVSYHINCNAGGFPNLTWNRNNDFVRFIPHKQVHTKLDSSFLFSDLKLYLKPTFEKQNTVLNSEAKIKIVVFWNFLMKRQSKRLIKLVKKNITLNKNKEAVEIYFVNNDKLYIPLE